MNWLEYGGVNTIFILLLEQNWATSLLWWTGRLSNTTYTGSSPFTDRSSFKYSMNLGMFTAPSYTFYATTLPSMSIPAKADTDLKLTLFMGTEGI